MHKQARRKAPVTNFFIKRPIIASCEKFFKTKKTT